MAAKRYRVDAYWAGYGHVSTLYFDHEGDGLADYAIKKATELLPWERCPDTKALVNLEGSLRSEGGLFLQRLKLEPPKF